MTRPGCVPVRSRTPVAVAAALALFAAAAEARGAGIFRGLTAQDRTQPVLLNAAGDMVSLQSRGHPAAGFANGTLPAYLAFPLHGGEHIPAQTPTVTTGPQPGEAAVGPLALTPSSQSTLNADLRASRGAIVHAPAGDYAVAMLPRYARALAQGSASSTTMGTIGPTGTTGPTSVASFLGINTSANWTINGLSSNKLSQWLQTGAKEISRLTTTGAQNVGHAVGLKVTPNSTGYSVGAQVLTPTTTTPTASAPPAASPEGFATPEPGGWLVFGLILGAAALRRRLA